MPFVQRPTFGGGIHVFDPGHFQQFVGVRLLFTGAIDDALGGPARDVADLAGVDPLHENGGDFNDLASGIDEVGGAIDPGDVYDLLGAVDGLGGELDNQAGQSLPGGETPDAGEIADAGNAEGTRRTIDSLGDRVDRVRRQLRR